MNLIERFRRLIQGRHPLATVPLVELDVLRPGQRARVIGTATRAGELIRAACSGAPCIAYRVTVTNFWTDYGPSFASGTESDVLLVESAGTSFELVTSKGRGRVQWDENATLLLRPSAAFIYRKEAEIPSHLVELLARHARRRTLDRGQLRFEEHRLEPESRVAVVGLWEREPSLAGGDAHYRAPPKRWLATAGDQGMAISNEPGAMRP